MLNRFLRPAAVAALLTSLGAAVVLPARAQTPSAGQPVATAGPLRLSLSQAVQYALKNKSTLQAQRLNEEIATARIGQIRSIGLPQINASAGVADNIKLQKSLVDFGAYSGPNGPLEGANLTPGQLAQVQAGQTVKLAPAYGEKVAAGPQAIAFGLQWQGSAGIQASQLLFDGSYLIGLKAAKVYEQLASKQSQQSEIDVVEAVQKAYYGVLVNRERFELLGRNVSRLDTIFRQTSAIYKEGFVEKLDVDRLQVQLTNLKVEQQKTQRLVDLTVALLKFQMGLDQQQPVELTDQLDAALVESTQLPAEAGGFNYGDRVEYSVLETQRDLANLDIRNKRAGYLPRLVATGGYGFVGSDPKASGLFQFRGPDSRNGSTGYPNQNWFGFANVGLQLQIPIFDGLAKHYSLQQAKLTAQTVNYGFTTLQQSIDLQQTQSRISLENSLDVVKNQKANLALATDVARVSKIKFQEGVGSNLEVITAETDLRSAQTNYYSSLYDALIAKVDFEKAQGTLKK
ncbi:MAG: TolC family protein [Hymenobacteraceae bacterium]|nr:TolC family protein [Hymenobacteraceae bacterium]